MTENDAVCIIKMGRTSLCEERGALGPFQSAGAVLLGTLGFDDHIVIGHVADGFGAFFTAGVAFDGDFFGRLPN